MIAVLLSLNGKDDCIMDTPGKIWHLIARSLNGEASTEEQEELMKLLARDESLRQQYELLTRVWAEKRNFEYEDGDDTRNTVSRIINKAEQQNQSAKVVSIKNTRRRRRAWLAAASFLIIALSGWFLFGKQFFSSDKKQEVFETGNGSRTRTLLLEDGTTVWLNAGSRLYYDDNFSGPTRDVRLEGEAFFDVAKNPARPFIVHTSGIDIKVLGTAFNVKSYPEDKTVETTLYHGSVQVFRESDPQKTLVQLKPNEKLILSKVEAANDPVKLPQESKPATKNDPPASFTIAYIDSTKKESERLETAWLYSRLEFRGDSFEETARKMERWYNVKIVFTDEKAMLLKVNGSFEKETVEQALAALKEAFPITYKINNHEIYIGSSE